MSQSTYDYGILQIFQLSSGDSDFELSKTSLTIPSGTAVTSSDPEDFCVDVIIQGDDLRELNETFTVVLTPVTPDDFEGTSQVVINIIDDGDSKFIHDLN